MKRTSLALVALFISVLALCQEPTLQIARVKKLSAVELGDAREKAKRGDVDAQIVLGLAYQGANQTVKPDATEARHWYTVAASHGNLDAKFWLVGLDYQEGQEPSIVRSKYQELAKAGHVGAMIFYATMCADGTGGPKDLPTAMSWWKRAAELGSGEGALDVGNMYLDAEGVPADKTVAVEWLRRAADKGSVAAAAELGTMALISEAGLQPGPEATKWLKMASEGGDGLSMFSLGMVLFHGFGTEADYIEAYKWFTLASERGQADGRKDMVSRMTTEQIATAEKRAATWNAEHR